MTIHLSLMLVIILIKLLILSNISFATDTITQLQSLTDGNTLVSEDGRFELGFFTPGTSINRYVGLWYKNIQVKTVVWVANRDNPIKDNSSMLSINTEGNLVLLNLDNIVLWSTNTTTNGTTKASNIVAQLLDSGNLVLREENDSNAQNYLWQSFDYPSDTLLPGMKIGWNFKTGLNRRLIAWKSWDDPSRGDLIWGLVPHNNPELVMWKGSQVFYRSGPAVGTQFSGSSTLGSSSDINYTFVFNKDELYFSHNFTDKSLLLILVLNQTTSSGQRLTWSSDTQTWRMSSLVPIDYCDTYNLCGPFGNCITGVAPICSCLEGFRPKSQQNWSQGVWTQGCMHNGNWSCRVESSDGFRKFSNMKMPDTTRSWLNESMTLEECKVKCWENCSCSAYANSNTRGQGSGCSMWFGDLLDLREISNGGQDLYIRLAASEIDQDAKGDSKKKVIVIASTISSLCVMLIIFTLIYWKRRSKFKEIPEWTRDNNNESKQEDLEVPLFDLSLVKHATNDFSTYNKLGEGGFGPVYKGKLPDGQEIAVKRLSQTSKQGLREFKNEVELCARLQHRNLVKVLGCCIQEDEKMLIYEFMANKSLDFFLFDSTHNRLLEWPMRFYIICGIARGLLYLHQDSRLRIIHRDLKASNVLLDNEMNPKISDFGLARMCGGDQIEGNTNRVVGTYGYMAPEYAFDGLFSIKSDVFSFGILLLEIVSGKKSIGLSDPSHNRNLIGHAWKLWKDGMAMQLIDECLKESCVHLEALRCIHIGLLCVQHHPNDRPNMASVVVMLSSESVLAEPKEPSFLIQKTAIVEDNHMEYQRSSSINEVSVSILSAR
ncbi:PREDICTED: G-type lectin S-receptor-like serine/threonine-protein kinase At4g27290 [Lupinus angustifolius]|uniref:G-type lectin S-receptor-like serine/threonine-protein kinase At4g27290 n=1 Tax=Lupinus angustifolius TaxID=3871 RepID=UPI00092EAD23|nr:PREDICTED: G-type lectin S-receptor-like serine/threonine-protein kinase At4g27290 [Lupinus angustifolius]